ncbi:MAG: sulfide/dihydroorotate dehydrogenase-like FAD/NAD-binding protein [Candidatus Omnitrophota bacterium]|nr:MAG: sulfide/dihydroorotate dehydrogenase-like FAD/NAD-binding protein [Candidatus Omnitrophota bacterium]
MKIVNKVVLAETADTRIVRIDVEAAVIAAKAQPGQFIVLMVKQTGERIPLTIVDKNQNKGTITLIFQEIGYSTKLLGTLKQGDSLYSLVGPLGHPTLVKNYGKVFVVAGGVGIAEALPLVKSLKEGGCLIYSILGAKTKELLILKDEIGKYCDKLYVSTDDGSLGEKGFVSDILERVLRKEKDFGLVYCVGPLPMMKVVSQITKPYNIKTTVCLNAIMLDATGMCGGCRLIEAGKVKFCCVDGPEFDGHLVDFDELMQRQDRFINEEKRSLGKFKDKGHKCRLDNTG